MANEPRCFGTNQDIGQRMAHQDLGNLSGQVQEDWPPREYSVSSPFCSYRSPIRDSECAKDSRRTR